MAVPSDMTADLIVRQAFRLAGINHPTGKEVETGKDFYLRGTLQDILLSLGLFRDNRLKTLQAFGAIPSVEGQNRYAFPSDFDEEITITILDGTETGTAQAGAADPPTITLAADATSTEEDVLGNLIFLYSGPGVNDVRQCIAYNTSTKIATVDSAWTATPTTATGYLVASEQTKLDADDLLDSGSSGLSTFATGKPTSYTSIGESGSYYMLFDKACDVATYGIYYRYYLDPNLLDLTSATMTVLYNRWLQVLLYGVANQIGVKNNDQKAMVIEKKYESLLAGLKERELPYKGEHKGMRTTA